MTSEPEHQWTTADAKPEPEITFVNEMMGEPYTHEEVVEEVSKLKEEVEVELKKASPEVEAELQAKPAIPKNFQGGVIEPGASAPIVPKPERTAKEGKILLRQLRKKDSVRNHTCASCFKRKSIEDFARFKLSESCMECERK